MMSILATLALGLVLPEQQYMLSVFPVIRTIDGVPRDELDVTLVGTTPIQASTACVPFAHGTLTLVDSGGTLKHSTKIVRPLFTRTDFQRISSVNALVGYISISDYYDITEPLTGSFYFAVTYNDAKANAHARQLVKWPERSYVGTVVSKKFKVVLKQSKIAGISFQEPSEIDE